MIDIARHTIKFIEEDFVTEFYQSGNRDLNLSTFSSNKKIIIEIKKSEKYNLFILLDCFYKSLDDYKNKYGYDELFKNGYFSWKSDAPANDYQISSNDQFIYNSLNIYNKEDSYLLELINNTNKNNFVIEFNTDRSRYGTLVCPIWDLFSNLKSCTDEYQQITIDEYVYQKKLNTYDF